MAHDTIFILFVGVQPGPSLALLSALSILHDLASTHALLLLVDGHAQAFEFNSGF